MDTPTWLYWSVLICFGYLLTSYVASGLLMLASLAELIVQNRHARTHDEDSTASSPFAIPVSVLAPLHNEESILAETLQSLLDFQYPEFEVIAVNDGSTDRTLDTLIATFDLERRDIAYQQVIETRPLRGVYVSRTHPNLLVVDKERGGKADALNCAANFARYRYICLIDGDTIYYPDALLVGMRPAQQDPSIVVGVGSAFTIHRNPEATQTRPGFDRIDRHVLTVFQLLDFLRSFLTTRLGTTRGRFMLCVSGAFAIWRRDIVVGLGGFSNQFTCEDIEFTFRVHEALRRQRTPYRIIALGHIMGATETPPTLGALISQRARWQRVILETVWAYRRMLFNPRYGSVGTVGVPHYLLTEVLAPFFQLLAIAAVITAWWQQLLDQRALQLLLIMAFSNGILSTMAILLHDIEGRLYPVKDLLWLVLLGPLDLFIYRPIMFVAQAKGVIDFTRGEKGWQKFERHRGGAAHAR